MPDKQPSVAGRPVIFGEVLFDCFEDGTCVLGGAPFNVAWHLRGFGLNPLFISRVGDDALGGQVIDAAQRWGLDTSAIQCDAAHPTGVVRITLDHGQPTFAILADQAYDFIDPQQATAAANPINTAVLYHGTLATRSAVSAEALNLLRQQSAAPTFVDINLRAPWWQSDSLHHAIEGASWVKLNDQELNEVCATAPAAADLTDAAGALCRRYRIDTLIVTRGAEGALLLDRGDVWSGRPPTLSSVTDTVGAGDAFSAVTLLGLLRGWSPPTVLTRAMQFAAALCGVRGATVADRDFYQRFLQQWQ